MTYKKKLIEVALPLEAINRESAREKSIRHGHPSTLHLWWARRPLAACRAVLFSSLVDDPSSNPDNFPTEKAQEKERKRLFEIIEDLVKWENINNDAVLNAAKEEIMKSTDGNPPPVLDPFCGGGSIPIEAQRLGLEAYGSDLNPVAVLITKALIEIPPKFAGMPPINHKDRNKKLPGENWNDAEGLTLDVRYYGKWIRDEAEKQIGYLYPKVKLPSDQGGGEATVIAWIWARTVKCPNPACNAQMPLVKSFLLSNNKNNRAFVHPRINHLTKTIEFEIKTLVEEPIKGTVNRQGAHCIFCDSPVSFNYLRKEGQSKRIKRQLMAVVAQGKRGRIYLPPSSKFKKIDGKTDPPWKPETELIGKAAVNVPLYGITTHGDLLTDRQLSILSIFCRLIGELKNKINNDYDKAHTTNTIHDVILKNYSFDISDYINAISLYASFALDKTADYCSSICSWIAGRGTLRNTFGRQALAMVWDYAEGNPLSDSTGSFMGQIEWVARVLANISTNKSGHVKQLDVVASVEQSDDRIIISTDPPYYDNIAYADLSDFFYIWLRKNLGKIYPDLLSTLLTPKSEELVATPYRHGGDKRAAQNFFEDGLAKSFAAMRRKHNCEYPLTVFYAFKQTETGADGDSSSTGWETMLEGLLSSGFSITGTWPMRSEMGNRMVASGSNALASSIVLVCRPQSDSAGFTTRRDFLNELKQELPPALNKLQQGNIAPVDLAQASIGPGMATFSKYTKVVESDGSQMTIRTALALINQTLDEVLAERESEYDPDTRWALAWFEQFGMEEGKYGVAETLSKAKVTSVSGLVEAGFLDSKGGKVRLLNRNELEKDWDPKTDKRLTIWEITQQLIRALESSEFDAANLVRKVGAMTENARDLAYRLYGICERKKWAGEAILYNSLVIAWPQIMKLASDAPEEGEQKEMSL